MLFSLKDVEMTDDSYFAIINPRTAAPNVLVGLLLFFAPS